MPTINELTTASEVFASDLFAFYSSNNGDARKASFSAIAALLKSLITAEDDKVTQYAAPSATAFTIAILDNSNSAWLILTPTAGFAAGAIKLPSVANAKDRQELLVNCTQSVATLTIDANGAIVTGAPTSLAANGFFRLRFDIVAKVWYRVG